MSLQKGPVSARKHRYQPPTMISLKASISSQIYLLKDKKLSMIFRGKKRQQHRYCKQNQNKKTYRLLNLYVLSEVTVNCQTLSKILKTAYTKTRTSSMIYVKIQVNNMKCKQWIKIFKHYQIFSTFDKYCFDQGHRRLIATLQRMPLSYSYLFGTSLLSQITLGYYNDQNQCNIHFLLFFSCACLYFSEGCCK